MAVTSTWLYSDPVSLQIWTGLSLYWSAKWNDIIDVVGLCCAPDVWLLETGDLYQIITNLHLLFAFVEYSCFCKKHQYHDSHFKNAFSDKLKLAIYRSGHETATVLLSGFAVSWLENLVTRQPQFRDLTHGRPVSHLWYFNQCQWPIYRVAHIGNVLQFIENATPMLTLFHYHGPLARYVKLWVAHVLGMLETFSPPPQVSVPDMHHGTYVTHVPWCMPGSLINGFLWLVGGGENIPFIPGACTTHTFTYLVRGLCISYRGCRLQ